MSTSTEQARASAFHRRVLLGALLLAVASASATSVIVTLLAGPDGHRSPARRAAPGPPVFSDPSRIDNPYLPLTRFTQCTIRGRSDSGTEHRSVRTLLPRPRTFEIGGARVDAVVIQDQDFENGQLVETTLDFYAQSDDGTVYYLGEEVSNFEGGKLTDTSGTWLYGRDTQRLGVAMPSNPKVGVQWHPEDVPGVASESARVEETSLRARVSGRIVDRVIRVQEFIQPDGVVEYKLYAPGIGIIAVYEPGTSFAYAGCR